MVQAAGGIFLPPFYPGRGQGRQQEREPKNLHRSAAPSASGSSTRSQ